MLCSIGLQAVIGVPGKNFFDRLPDALSRFAKPEQHVVFIPDTDATPEVLEIAKQVKCKRKSVVELWQKPDDFIQNYGAGTFLNCLRLPRPL